MYSVIDLDLPAPPAQSSRVAGELGAILQLRQAAIESRELLYCSPVIRSLVEDEIPRLVALVARGQRL